MPPPGLAKAKDMMGYERGGMPFKKPPPVFKKAAPPQLPPARVEEIYERGGNPYAPQPPPPKANSVTVEYIADLVNRANDQGHGMALQRAVGVNHYISQTLRYHETNNRRFQGTARPKTPSSGSSSITSGLPTLDEGTESESDLSAGHNEGRNRGEQATAIPELISAEDLAGDVDVRDAEVENLRQSYDEARAQWMAAAREAQTTAIPALPEDDHSNQSGIEWITGPFAKQGAVPQDGTYERANSEASSLEIPQEVLDSFARPCNREQNGE